MSLTDSIRFCKFTYVLLVELPGLQGNPILTENRPGPNQMSIRPLAGEAVVALYPQALSGGCGRSPKAHNGHVPSGTFGGAAEEVHKTIVEERGPSPSKSLILAQTMSFFQKWSLKFIETFRRQVLLQM
ncbi:hypothetical protein Y032_0030g2069 [Ancylostoma ceylanicum]|uniref:Uncharacterized protein n=1 Tax=Ancylostoma ceylanicum TaxID=53326 RepID=A0A016UQK6_9BILA|nr:hypothetical protein Y032_0030g2069 [Ancylostoma ceylanicum]